MSEVEEKVRKIVADIVGVDWASISAESCSETVEGWDSVAQLSILLAIDAEFGCRPPIERILEFTSVRGLADFVQNERDR